MPLSIVSNIAKWAGSVLSPAASTSPIGNEVAPVVRVISKKTSSVLYPQQIMTAGASTPVNYDSGWQDTNLDGTIFLGISSWSDIGSNNGGIRLFTTMDPSTPLVDTIANVNGIPAGVNYLSFQINKRYWKIQLLGPTSGTVKVQLAVTLFNHIPLPVVNLGGTGVFNPLGVSAVSSSGTADGQLCLLPSAGNQLAAAIGTLAVGMHVSPGTNTFNMLRTPAVFRSGMSTEAASNGVNTIWTPAVGKKFRLMRYKFEVGADCTLAAATGVSLTFTDGGFIGFSIGSLAHRFSIPAAAITSSGEDYASEWIDLGNGALSAAANNALGFLVNIPLAAAAYNPTFAMTSGQWECAGISFKAKTTAQKVQQKTATASTSAVAVTPTNVTMIGNTVVVAVRTTNPAGGGPTITITDVGGNTWSSETIRTNASDTTNGSSLQIFYSTITAATGAITATTTGNLATQMKISVLEYTGIIAVDVHNIGATGNSAAPASGVITTSVAGDVIIGAAANGGSSNTLTAAAGFQIRSSLSDANGSIGVVDNLATTSLTAGAINVVVCGTEE
jgi:hypothetical protein